MMYLHARTNVQGSEVKTPLNISYDEWLRLSEQEKDELVKEALTDLVDSWVEDYM